MRITTVGTAVGLRSQPLPGGGRSWSLSTVFHRLLKEAEKRYGPRDRSYSYVGLEFGGPIPSTWYPESGRDVAIVLSDDAALNVNQACFQLAHEVVHLLCPTGKPGATAFEEGLAAMFSDDMSSLHGWNYFTQQSAYTEPSRLVRLAITAKANGVRHLRATKPLFGDWLPADLEAEFGTALTASERDFLCAQFVP